MKAVLVLLALVAVSFGWIPLLDSQDPTCIKGQWIVAYKWNTSLEDAQKHWGIMEATGVSIMYKYDMGADYRGMAGTFTDEQIAHLQTDPLVAQINCNCIAHAYCDTVQSGATWGLARSSHTSDITNGVPATYEYDSGDQGTGINVFVLDTGVYTAHNDFGTRATFGANFAGGGNADGNGHGTHCAGTIGGTIWGIAKNVNIVAVKVLGDNGSGSYAGIINGINWVAAFPGSNLAKIISMSLGGNAEGGLTGPCNAAVNAGVVIVVAAGNSNANACNFYPAGIASCITVAASDTTASGPGQIDVRASFSNFGTCCDIFAPGDAITSAWIGAPTATRVLSGTSMACPHVAGEAAVLRSRNRGYSPQQIRDLLVATSHQGIVQNPGAGTPNNLLYNGC